MAARIISSVAAIVVNLVTGIVIFFILLLVMNGYSESDAEWGLFAYGTLSLMALLISGGIAFSIAGFLLKRNYRGQSSGLLSAVIAILTGIALQFVTCLVAMLITETVRLNF